jgi:hypothetical protein
MAGEDPFAALKGAQQKQQPQVSGTVGDTAPQEPEKRPAAPPPVESSVNTPVASGAAAATATAAAVRKSRLLSRPEKITGYVSSDMKAVLADLAHKPRANGKYPKGEAEVIAWLLELGRKSWERDGKPPMP